MSGDAGLFRARQRAGLATLARCWEIARRDGLRLGFTDHDRDLAFGGLVFEAGAGLDAGALERSAGLSVDNAQAVGALRSDRVSEADVLAGRFDGAEVRLWLVDWSDPRARVEQFRGGLGEIRVVGGAFEAELRGLAERLNQPLGRAYLRGCDRVLGDARCGVDVGLPALMREAEVVQAITRGAVLIAEDAAHAPGWFRGGALEWLSGANAGLAAVVREDRGEGVLRRLVLWSEAKAEVAPGDRLRVVAGCDKRFETCRDRFANALNFRGFPHMPGEDWVMAYPRAGDVHDGGPTHWQEDGHAG
ncbi:DUF2163 domain-containing protein [Halovulum dunhuangense]|uniref:DUF2163 domain-containing protein n=1 Tax=Halovulum dunhuangense TaxID=1505036 RepID=A0A849L6Z3_9RHOB|nr:DUF2163 domain-containing protein [Halovulum dunhuangense]NNU81914.1 DUF2163 domain-containing protein [Halovulum dunhuangense]